MMVKKVPVDVELHLETFHGRYVIRIDFSFELVSDRNQLGISTGVYTAAGSQALYDTDGASW